MNSTGALTLFVTVALCLSGMGQEPSAPDAPVEEKTIVLPQTEREARGAEQPDLAAVEKELVQQTNAFRRQEERDTIKANETLTKAARQLARHMAQTGRYGHHADGRTPAERVAAAGYEYCMVRENIAYAIRSDGFSTERLVEKFFGGWKESPGHRRNMLARHVTETGVAIAKSERGTYFAVQLFARPRSAAVAFRVRNDSGVTVTYRIGEQEFPLPPRVTRSHQECQPRTVKFLPTETDDATSEPATPVERVRVKGGERLTVQPADDGYRVVVSQGGEAE